MPDSISLPNGDSIELDSTLERGLRTFQKFCACGHEATALCDWKVAAHKTGTCDTPICPKHLKQVAPGKVLCPQHQLEYDRWKARRKNISEAEQRSLFSEAA